MAAPPHGVLNTTFGPADVLFMGIVAGWSLALVCGQDRIGSPPGRIAAPLFVFVLASGLAIVSALNQAAALHFAIRSAALAVLYLYVHRGIEARRFAPATLAPWLVPGLALNGLLAIAQFVHQEPLGLTWLGEPGTLREVYGTPVILVHGTRVLRAFGVLPHPNVLGGLLAAALPLVAGLLLRPLANRSATEISGSATMAQPLRQNASRRRGLVVLRDMLLLLSVALMAAGIVLSFSRSAWLGLLCGGLFLIARRVAGKRNAIFGSFTKRGLLVAASIGVVVAGLLTVEWNAVSVRLQPDSNRLERIAIQQRLSLLDRSFKVIFWRPLTGVGGDNFSFAADRFLPPDQRGQWAQYPVHNTYLLAQAELGPLGAAAWLALMAAPLLGLAFERSRRRSAATPRPAGQTAPARETWARATDPVQQIGSSLVEYAEVREAPRGYAQHGMAAWTRWQALAGCSLVVVAAVGLVDWYIWGNGPGNEPVAVLWIIALALFSAPVH